MATSTETKIIEIKVDAGAGIKQIGQLTAEIGKLQADQKLLKNGDEAQKQQYEKNAIAIKEYSQQKRILQREIQTEVKAAQSAMGAYDKLQIAYTKAAAKAKDLAAEQGLNSRQAIAAAIAANNLNDKLKAIDKTVGQNQRSVADYGIGLSGLPGIFGQMAASGQTVLVALRNKFDSVKDATMQYTQAQEIAKVSQLESSAAQMAAMEAEAVAATAATAAEAARATANTAVTTTGAASAGATVALTAAEEAEAVAATTAATAEAARGKATTATTTATEAAIVATNGLKVQMLALFGNPVMAAIAGVAVLVAGFIALTRNAMEFKLKLSELEAITGATGQDLVFLKEKAQQMSSQYGISAIEVVNAMKLVGSAKPELLSNVKALAQMTDAVMILSKASSLDLGESTKALTQIMNQFGVSADQANKFINVLGAGAKYGAVEIPYLNEAIVKVGGTADSAGLSIEQLTAMMELFGEKGIVAEKAGTGFKKILVELQKDTANYEKGIFSLDKAIANNQSIAKDNIALQEKFGEHYFDLAGILFKNSEKFKQLTKDITGTNVAFEQAAIVMNNLAGDTDKAGKAWTNLMLSIEDGEGVLSDISRWFVQAWTGLLTDLTLLSKDIKRFFIAIGDESDYLNMRIQSVVDTIGMSFGKLNIAIQSALSGDFSKFKTLFSDINEGIKAFSKENVDKAYLASRAIKSIKDEASKPVKPSIAPLTDSIVELTKVTKEQQKELDKLNKIKQNEYELNRKLSAQFQQMKADARAQIQTTASLSQKPFNKKIEVDPVEASKAKREQMLQDSIDAYDNQLNLAQNNADETLRLTQLSLSDQMNLELTGIKEGSQAEFNIREKYRQMNEEADKQATSAKIQNVMNWANSAADVLDGAFSFSNAIAANELDLWAKQNKGKADFDEEYAKKKAKLDHDAAVRNKAMQVVNAIINGAASVVSLLHTPPLAIAAGIAAALQIAAIIATPIPSADSTDSASGSGVSSLPPDLTSKMAVPLTGSVASIQANGGSNAITSGATITGNIPTFDYKEFAKAVAELPAPELSIVELKTKQKQVSFIENISTISV